MAGGIERLKSKESCRILLNGEPVHDSTPSPDGLRAKIRELLSKLKKEN